MLIKRRATAARLAAVQQSSRQLAHYRNMAAVREEMVVAEWRRQEKEDRVGAEVAMAMDSQHRDSHYPFPSYQQWKQREDDRRTFTNFLKYAEHRR
jgi:hypothetical protein